MEADISYIKNQIADSLNEMEFLRVCLKYKNDAKSIFDELQNNGKVDDNSLGFWVWDLQTENEYYSDKFREVLGFKDDIDFPNTPDSWKGQITEDSLAIAIENYLDHVQTGGEFQYSQLVSYRKKSGKIIELICHGKIFTWEGKSKKTPLIMIGVHMPKIGSSFSDY